MNCKILLIFAALFVGGNALKCYSCGYDSASGVQADCQSPPAAKYLQDCPSLSKSCLKVATTLLGNTATVLSCGMGIAPPGGCVAGVCTSSCKTDGCNSSNSVKISLLAMIGAIVSGFLLANY